MLHARYAFLLSFLFFSENEIAFANTIQLNLPLTCIIIICLHQSKTTSPEFAIKPCQSSWRMLQVIICSQDLLPSPPLNSPQYCPSSSSSHINILNYHNVMNNTQDCKSKKKKKNIIITICRMEIKVENESREFKAPLLPVAPQQADKTLVQKAISQTFQSTAHLANLLPTGSVLAFQLLSPIFTNQGECDSLARSSTAILIALCGLSCFLLSFTDSFKDDKGDLCYGFATLHGLWIIDGSATIPPALATQYKLKFIDFMHAFISILVFAAVALFDQDVVNCFYPQPSDDTRQLLTVVPVGIGVICSMLFVAFPTKRHGIGFPLTANN